MDVTEMLVVGAGPAADALEASASARRAVAAPARPDRMSHRFHARAAGPAAGECPIIVGRRRAVVSPRGFLCAMKTYVATPATAERNWFVVDATGLTLGRLATRIADTLRGKLKPEYTPHIDTGDFVIVVNAEKISVTGDKRQAKLYHRHSGYPGGLKTRTLQEMLDRRPEEVIRLAVKGMLPRNRLARKQLTKLKVYAGPDHPHVAQKPQPLEIED
jgi:large subunit ribosomal protein L13